MILFFGHVYLITGRFIKPYRLIGDLLPRLQQYYERGNVWPPSDKAFGN